VRHHAVYQQRACEVALFGIILVDRRPKEQLVAERRTLLAIVAVLAINPPPAIPRHYATFRE
jgi:hypothetical protein